MEMVQTLLDHGADVNPVDRKLRTPLHLAVNINTGGMNENFDLILYLLKQEGDLGRRDLFGRLPLHYVFIKIGRLV